VDVEIVAEETSDIKVIRKTWGSLFLKSVHSATYLLVVWSS
jgi:hypothetical protein